jgi:hypothetical protein
MYARRAVVVSRARGKERQDSPMSTMAVCVLVARWEHAMEGDAS